MENSAELQIADTLESVIGCLSQSLARFITFQLSLKRLAFYALTTPDKRSGLSCLQSACIKGHIETVNAILNYSPDKLDSAIALSVKFDQNSSHFPGKPILTVVEQLAQDSNTHRQIIQLVEKITKHLQSQSLLHLAARKGKVEHLRRLLDCGEYVDSVDQLSKNGETPLMLAARFNDVGPVEFLLERGASLEIRDNQGYFPIHYAAIGGKTRNIRRLIELGADVNVLNETDECYGGDLSSVFLAAEHGHTEAVDLMLKQGADPNKPSRYGVSPLHIAARNGHSEAIHLLLKNGGNLNSHDLEDFLPLHRAAEMEHTDVVKFILQNGGSATAKTGDGQTLLHLATRLDLVSFLVQNGADINARDHRRQTPLMAAAEKGQTDTVTYLLHQGANINGRDRCGCSALYDALKGGHAATATVLIKRGCELKLVNDEYCAKSLNPPLLLQAASEGRTDILQLLIQTGLSVNTKTVCGQTPLNAAVQFGNCTTIAFLLDRGARVNSGDTDSDFDDDDKDERFKEFQRHPPLCWALKLGQGNAANTSYGSRIWYF